MAALADEEWPGGVNPFKINENAEGKMERLKLRHKGLIGTIEFGTGGGEMVGEGGEQEPMSRSMYTKMKNLINHCEYEM